MKGKLGKKRKIKGEMKGKWGKKVKRGKIKGTWGKKSRGKQKKERKIKGR